MKPLLICAFADESVDFPAFDEWAICDFLLGSFYLGYSQKEGVYGVETVNNWKYITVRCVNNAM